MRRSILVAWCVVLLVAAVTSAVTGYVVVLKSGKRLRAREKFDIQGKNALIVLHTGTLVSYPLELIDLVETERYNQMGLGNALTIDELDIQSARPTPTPKLTLGEYAQIDAGLGKPELGDTAPPTPLPTPGISLKHVPYHDPRVEEAFAQILDERKLYQYRTSAGTQSDYFFLRAVTDTQREVFKSLKTVAEAFAIINELHPEISPEAVELEMVTLSNKPAGTFRITPKQAKEVASGAVPVEKFYVDNVIF